MTLIEKVLKDAILECTVKVSENSAQITHYEALNYTILQDKKLLILELQKHCEHQNTVQIAGTYMSGGYDHVSEQTYTLKCEDCEKVLGSKLIRGTYA